MTEINKEDSFITVRILLTQKVGILQFARKVTLSHVPAAYRDNCHEKIFYNVTDSVNCFC